MKINRWCCVTTHWMTWTPIHNIWMSILDRTKYKGNRNYKRYWPLGICDERLQFENFYRDMWDKPEWMSIDRIDNEKWYSKENCRWATPKQQSNNKKNNIIYKWKTLMQYCEENNLPYYTIHKRINGYWWSIQDAVTKPIRKVRSSRPTNTM